MTSIDDVRSAASAAAESATGAVQDARRRRRERRRGEHREWRKRRLTVVYWLWFVLLLLATLLVSLLVVRLMFTFHVLITPGAPLLLTVFTITSVIVGAIFSQVIVRGFTRPLLEMSDAAQRIAAGDFDIQLKERTFAEEIEDMAEDFTQMARQLAATEMMRSDFMSNVSHEIKTPLAAIEGYATLQQDPSLPPEKQVAYAGKVLENARRLSKLTDDILLLSRLENDDGQLQREPFSLDEQLREAALLHEDLWSSGKRVLSVQLQPLDYDGNADLLFHVWQNLLGNAVKFTDEGDEVHLGLRSLPDGGVEVQVRDSGIGMSEQERERAFEKFYQADTSRATKGNGLGLALAQRIVALHGGTITTESAPGQGTAVTVRLP